MRWLLLIIMSATLINLHAQDSTTIDIPSLFGSKEWISPIQDSIITLLEAPSTKEVVNVRQIPQSIYKELRKINGSRVSIVNSNNRKFTRGCDSGSGIIPSRRLLFCYNNGDKWLIGYEHGGWGYHQHILYIEYKGKEINELACFAFGFSSIIDFRNIVLNGELEFLTHSLQNGYLKGEL